MAIVTRFACGATGGTTAPESWPDARLEEWRDDRPYDSRWDCCTTLLFHRTELGHQVKSLEFVKAQERAASQNAASAGDFRRCAHVSTVTVCDNRERDFARLAITVRKPEAYDCLGSRCQSTALRAWRECVGAGRFRRGLRARWRQSRAENRTDDRSILCHHDHQSRQPRGDLVD